MSFYDVSPIDVALGGGERAADNARAEPRAPRRERGTTDRTGSASTSGNAAQSVIAANELTPFSTFLHAIIASLTRNKRRKDFLCESVITVHAQLFSLLLALLTPHVVVERRLIALRSLQPVQREERRRADVCDVEWRQE